MSDLGGKPGRRGRAKKKPDLTAPVRVVTPAGAIIVGKTSSKAIDAPRPRQRHTYQLINSSDRRRLAMGAKIPEFSFADFIDQIELAVFEWQSAREEKNVYLNDDVQKILSSIAKSLRLLNKHNRFSILDTPKGEIAELMRRHNREEQALQPILELICPGWTDRPRPDFRRALEAIKAVSGIGLMGPKHQSSPHVVAAGERVAVAWRRYSKLPLSGGTDEGSPQGYLTVLLSKINIYEPYGLVPGQPKRVPRTVLADFQEQVVMRELALTIDRIRDRSG